MNRKRLTKAKTSNMVGNMRAKVVSQNRDNGIITAQGVKFHIIPEKEYRGMVATAEINSDPEMCGKMKEAFADPNKVIFDSIEEMEKYLDSDDDGEGK
ncbi:MAG: hypothetical protein LBI47_02760 [Puniceicoccales bacterium]|jgi:hypothetical protein|nr:hypothetical protein [Puniceicoccales bacterium]